MKKNKRYNAMKKARKKGITNAQILSSKLKKISEQSKANASEILRAELKAKNAIKKIFRYI